MNKSQNIIPFFVLQRKESPCRVVGNIYIVQKGKAGFMKIPFETEGKTIKYTDTRGVVRKGFVVSVYDACDGPGDEAGILFSGEYENLDVPESQIASFEIIDAELASYDESLKSRERSIVL